MPIIRPEIFITPDCPTVKFRESPESLNLNIEIPKILSTQGWGLGTIFCIQFVNHERTKLIKIARFIVTEEHESIQTFNPDSPQPMTKLVQARAAKQIESWFYAEDAPIKDNNPSAIVEKVVKWNFGAKKHDVMQGEKVIFSSTSKEEAEKFRDAA